MIRNSYHLLMSLKTLVSSDTDEVWIDYENEKFVKVHDASEPENSIPFPRNEPSVKGLLKNLSSEGFLVFDGEEYFSLTYKALYYSQIIRQERVQYFICSIFVPIILSFVTTLITNLLSPTLLKMLLEYLQSLV